MTVAVGIRRFNTFAPGSASRGWQRETTAR
jgi:hypothetical protein